jgi:hypothetical protein
MTREQRFNRVYCRFLALTDNALEMEVRWNAHARIRSLDDVALTLLLSCSNDAARAWLKGLS